MTKTFITWRANNNRVDDIDRMIEFIDDAKKAILANEDLELVLSCAIEKKEIWIQLVKLEETEILDPDEPYDAKAVTTMVLGCVADRLREDGSWEHLEVKN